MIDPAQCEECGADMRPEFDTAGKGNCAMWICRDCGFRSAATGRERLITQGDWYEAQGTGPDTD